MVLRYAFAKIVYDTKKVLNLDMASVGCHTEPYYSFNSILLYSLFFAVHDSKGKIELFASPLSDFSINCCIWRGVISGVSAIAWPECIKASQRAAQITLESKIFKRIWTRTIKRIPL